MINKVKWLLLSAVIVIAFIPLALRLEQLIVTEAVSARPTLASQALAPTGAEPEPTTITIVVTTPDGEAASAAAIVAPSIATASSIPEAPAATAQPIRPTSVASPVPHIYLVRPGDTLAHLAQRFGLSVEQLMAVNGLQDHTIIIDQRLIIPDTTSAEATTAAMEMPAAAANGNARPTASQMATATDGPAGWPPSLYGADTESNYPLVWQSPDDLVVVHYQPGTYAAQQMPLLGSKIDESFYEIQRRMSKQLNRPVDVYLAGTLFANNAALQGLAESRNFRPFILVNGAFDVGERDYGGMENLDAVYETADYAGVYGRSLSQLDQEWQSWIANIELEFNALDFVNLSNAVADAYERCLAAGCGCDHAGYPTYLQINRARLALNQGALDDAERELQIFWTLFDG